MKTLRNISILMLLFTGLSSGQETYPVDGLRTKTPSIHAFTNATIVVKPGQVLHNATLLVRDGIVEAAGQGIAVPADAVLHDAKGFWIYPGLIDAFSDYGSKPVKRGGDGNPAIQPSTMHWNAAVRVEFSMAEKLTADTKKASDLRSLGFSTIHARPNDGIFRGTGTVMNLGEKSQAEETLVANGSINLSFDKGSSSEPYPSSLMGAVALIRQTFMDADWYKKASAKQPGPEPNLSLEILNRQLNAGMPIIFDAANTQDIFRATAIAREFGLRFTVAGAGNEFERIEDLKALGVPLIVPVNYPEPIDVSDPDDAIDISLQELRRWELAPTNPAALANAGMPFAITASGLKDMKTFWSNIHKAMACGLTEDKALEALSVTPARFLGIDKFAGSLEKGKIANFIIASGNLFKKGTTVHENWIGGVRYTVEKIPDIDIRAEYELQFGERSYKLEISGSLTKPAAKLFFRDSTALDGDVGITDRNLLITVRGDSLGQPGMLSFKGIATTREIGGLVSFPSGEMKKWTATRKKDYTEKPEDNSIKPDTTEKSSITFPNFGYGLRNQPEQNTVLIRNATVWTNTEKGILTGADILIEKGKIKEVGRGLSIPKGAVVVDGTGKHVTPGIIDEHSHIAVTRGVNEGTQAVSAEVRIGDALDAEDIDIYRQLAGGVTTSHVLHGSANPIGGQTQLIKLRWGQAPEKMKFEGAPGFIKFALGENVKQSNWGDEFTTRYPQTRIGVEQLIKDEFQAAKEYKAAWEKYRKAGAEKSNLPPPRRDLELDAIVEILEGKRFITCHSYVQSEITMLIRLAEEMGFKINTFTHILEGYKVADKMKKHGAAGSTFSDWWAYKFEVYDAIPYNGALMHEQGVTVAYNSDDAEMARRLNQEAAKAVKYGGVSEEEAFKFVTLNPAKMLHVEDRVGSLKPGMDADVVLWNDDPLSIYAKSLQTYVDGRLYYDAGKQGEMRQAITAERARLIQKMILEKKGGASMRKPSKKDKQRYDCEDMSSDYGKGEIR